MTEPKFTKGPWRIAEKGNFGNMIEAYRGGETYEFDSGYRVVAMFQACTPSRVWEDEEENRLANGRLIAAAPQMYEALRAIVHWNALRGDKDEILPIEKQDDEIGAAMRALSSATGEA